MSRRTLTVEAGEEASKGSSESESPPRLVAGSLAAALAVVVWAAPSIMAKGLPMEAVPIVLYRGWLGVFWGLLVLGATGGRLNLRVLRVCALGGVALAIDLVCFFVALKLTTVANATLISAMPPVLLIFLAPLLFGERVRWPDISGALLAVVGASLVVLGSQVSSAWSPVGDAFAVVTLFAWTAYLIASKRVRGAVRATEFTAAVTLIASTAVTPLAVFGGFDLTLPPPSQLGVLATMAVLGWCGHVLMNWALGHIPIWVGGAAALAVPVVASALAAVFLAETFRPIQLVGMLVVVISLTWVSVRSPKVLGD